MCSSSHKFQHARIFGDEQDPNACEQDLFLQSNPNLVLFPSKRRHLNSYIMDDDLTVDEEDARFGEGGGCFQRYDRDDVQPERVRQWWNKQ